MDDIEMRPFYKSRKFWTTIITFVADLILLITGNESLVAAVTAIGVALVTGFGLEDFGKAKEALRARRYGLPSDDIHVTTVDNE